MAKEPLPTYTLPPRAGAGQVGERTLTGAADGAFLGSLAPEGAALPLAATGGIAGGLFGRWTGKQAQQDERENGWRVPPPSMRNSGLLTGASLGLLAGVAGVFLTGGLSLLAGGILAGCIGASSLIGGFVTKRSQQKEYNAAKAYVAEHGEYVPPQAKVAAQPTLQPQKDIAPVRQQAATALNPKDIAALRQAVPMGQVTAVSPPGGQESAVQRLMESRSAEAAQTAAPSQNSGTATRR